MPWEMTRRAGLLLLAALCIGGAPAGAHGAEAPYFLIAHDHRCAEASQLQSGLDPDKRSLEECYQECLANSECAYFAHWPSTGELGSAMDACRIYASPCLPFSSLLEGYHNNIYQMGDPQRQDPRSHIHSAVGVLMGGRERASSVEHSHLLVALSLVLSLSAILATVVLGMAALAAATGVPVPLLAALPSTSAALLPLQLAALASREGAGALGALADLGCSFAWARARSPDAGLALGTAALLGVYLARRSAAARRRRECGEVPHGLSPGAWELRAAGLLALPLAAGASGALRGHTSVPIVGAPVAIGVLLFLAHHVLLSAKFVSEAVSEGRVVRTALPSAAGGSEVFVDAACSQLRSLPAPPPQPGCSLLFGDWPSSPAWCIAPTVADIHEVRQAPRRGDEEAGGGLAAQWASRSPWSSAEDSEALRAELDEDELQGKPLLLRAPEASSGEGAALLQDEAPGGGAGERGGAGSSGLAAARSLPSAVSRNHPVVVGVRVAHEVKAQDLVAGVACNAWLDCAVPAGALRRIQDAGCDVTLQVHPCQLCGPCSGGRFAACFDWGTRWPWQWSAEVALRVALGVWVSAPLAGASFLGVLGHLAMLALVAWAAYATLKVRPYEHRNDNVAVAAACSAAVLIVLLRALCSSMPATSWLLSVAAAMAMLVPCGVALLAALGLASAALGRLEATSLHDRLLPRTVVGWGAAPGSPPPAPRSFSGDGIGGCGLERSLSDAALERHAVEVILPGQRAAFAIVLPALARPRVVHAQLLPPVSSRPGDPEALPPCAATGDRARLPAPPGLLCRGGEGADEAGRRGPPAAALLAPGLPGRLLYEAAECNEGGLPWRDAVRQFFGTSGSLLAEEAERLVEAHARLQEEGGPDDAPGAAGTSERVLVIIEVLPAFAAEFVDERRGPRGG